MGFSVSAKNPHSHLPLGLVDGVNDHQWNHSPSVAGHECLSDFRGSPASSCGCIFFPFWTKSVNRIASLEPSCRHGFEHEVGNHQLELLLSCQTGLMLNKTKKTKQTMETAQPAA